MALLTVVVVFVDDDGNAFWQQISPGTVRETPKGFALVNLWVYMLSANGYMSILWFPDPNTVTTGLPHC